MWAPAGMMGRDGCAPGGHRPPVTGSCPKREASRCGNGTVKKFRGPSLFKTHRADKSQSFYTFAV